MKISETELPGVGRRYTASFPGGGQFVVVIHNDGRRRTYWRGSADDDSEPLFELTEPQAERLAEVFDGSYFTPVSEDLEDAFDDAPIRWIDIDGNSPVAGASIRETRLRSETGVSILAIRRDDRTVSNPDPDTEIRTGDTLVVVGTEEAYDELDRVLGR
ncbi:potassium transporter TrkA [Halobaculum sp. WSA2]|uniref:Potassium transporter TrkA n=1 Tax=Halobaculum saliterrae TaxID=2073113 RepID=A0A6B0STQ8_9EURY|nr:TrkA C-terminal domain-containing protein [Halobaculum saliterrae]MXR42348.1 potassium transporter TrkA [Halobaculum saliterrae]